MNADLTHVVKVLELSDDTNRALVKQGYVTLRRLLSLTTKMGTIAEAEKVSPSDVDMIEVFLEWYGKVFLIESTLTSIQTDFDEDAWDEFLAERHRNNITPAQKPPPKSNGESRRNNNQPINPADMVPEVAKLDPLKAPSFSGKAENWLKFRRLLRTFLQPYGLDRLLSEDFKVPEDTDTSYPVFQAQNNLLHSILTQATKDGKADTYAKRNDLTRDGRETYLQLNEAYHDQNSKNAAAARAISSLERLHLHRGIRDGAEGYLRNWDDALADLSDMGHTYDPLIQKVKFLDGIQDPAFSTTV